MVAEVLPLETLPPLLEVLELEIPAITVGDNSIDPNTLRATNLLTFFLFIEFP
jgi:hypothetical protein